MTFKKILVALDGSRFSELAAQYAFWFAEALGSEVNGQHVLDSRVMDALLAPEFGGELDMEEKIVSAEKVYDSLKNIAEIVLGVFSKEAAKHGIRASSHLDEGPVVDEIVKRSAEYDLVISGHHGRRRARIASDLITGSIAERISVMAHKPVLIALEDLSKINQILVAFDGSEPARGSLLLGQHLSERLGKPLKAMIVIPNKAHEADAHIILEQSSELLKEKWSKDIFIIKEGSPASAILEYTKDGGNLLIVGAYGFSDPQENVLGSTTTRLVRRMNCSLLVYR